MSRRDLLHQALAPLGKCLSLMLSLARKPSLRTSAASASDGSTQTRSPGAMSSGKTRRARRLQRRNSFRRNRSASSHGDGECAISPSSSSDSQPILTKETEKHQWDVWRAIRNGDYNRTQQGRRKGADYWLLRSLTPCQYFMEHRCNKGDGCDFSHDPKFLAQL